MLFARCDDRLVHGQVLFKWVDHEQIKKIIIVDDKTASDIIEKQMIQMTKPKNCEVSFLTSSQMDQIQADTNNKSMVLFKNIHLACHFVQQYHLASLNLGRMASGIGKTKVLSNLFLTSEESQRLLDTIDQGIRVYSQMVPEDEAIDLETYLRREAK